MDNVISVYLWDQLVGALLWLDDRQIGQFEYAPEFLKQGLPVAPFRMPILANNTPVYEFRDHIRSHCFNGLPGMLADTLPDKFGNDILRAWLASRGLDTQNLTPALRLSYVGQRGMGALEFKPAQHSKLLNHSVEINIEEMAKLCESIIAHRHTLDASFKIGDDKHNREAMNDIIRIGSSAGGAKPKAVIAMNGDGYIRSGQVDVPDGYTHYLIKFDIAGDFDRAKNNGIPPASGRIEYAYHKMALDAGIKMMPCCLMEIDGHGHFLTERFDRIGNQKIHVQTLAAIEHLDRDTRHDYMQLITTANKLKLGMPAIHEIFRRMVFNVITYNHDDHTKNHAFMMDQSGTWSLTPAYDVTYAYDPTGAWTRKHQMSVNNKQDNITYEDLMTVAAHGSITKSHAHDIIKQVKNAASNWTTHAQASGLDTTSTGIIARLLDITLKEIKPPR